MILENNKAISKTHKSCEKQTSIPGHGAQSRLCLDVFGAFRVQERPAGWRLGGQCLFRSYMVPTILLVMSIKGLI